MFAQRPLPESFDLMPDFKQVRCCGCERHIVAAEQELSALVTAASVLYGDEEAHRVAEDWIGLAGDRNAPLAVGCPALRRLTAAAIQQLAQRRVQRQQEQQIRGTTCHIR